MQLRKRAERSDLALSLADEVDGERKGPALVVGLGNPGIEYQFTPHNAGFLAIDRLAEQGGVRINGERRRADAELHDGDLLQGGKRNIVRIHLG